PGKKESADMEAENHVSAISRMTNVKGGCPRSVRWPRSPASIRRGPVECLFRPLLGWRSPALRRQRLIQGGDLAQAGGGFQRDAPGPAVLDVLGDQARLAGAALGTGAVVQHQIVNYRLGHGRFPLQL